MKIDLSRNRVQRTLQSYLSRFHYNFIRSLVYMLQASEYSVGDYLDWVERTNDFAHVEKRKRLKMTWKAKALLACAWLLTAAAAFLVIEGFRNYDIVPYFVAALIIILFPLALPWLLLLPLAIIEAMQLPVEQSMIVKASQKLKKHKGFKIAVAGSYGKTSMREILRTVLSEGTSTSFDNAQDKSLSVKKKVAAPGGSENTPIGIARFVERLSGDEEVLIFELGEYYPGDIKRLAKIVRPDMGIITGVNEAHLSKFKTVEAAAATIFELQDYLNDKPVYVNAENAAALALASAAAVRFSREEVGEWKVVAPETSLDGTSFMLERGSERITVQSKLLGLHQIGPLAAAAHIAKQLGLTNEQIALGLAKTKAFDHRLERKDDATGVITLDDSYNGNPDGVKAVIEFLASIENHRRWYVTPGLVEMGDRSEAVHKEIGKQLAQAGIEKVVLIRNSVTPWVEQGLKENSFGGEIIWFDEALKCYEQLPYMTVAGDVVLLQNDWPDQYA